ncbi:hypothetical protein SLS53_001772 [Cytospora paraplurivora]|uniref:Uncharacterized protein n=1 Tax=Cytospora paraplurivora TaxID=2898453 RepID=A0AAN9UGZ8_9PEZI
MVTLERFDRTNICVLEYPRQKAEVGKTRITTASGLKEYLSRKHDDSSVGLRLFVVEDLSRRVIEALGSTFDIDPSFFREHILDYVWYNVKPTRFTDLDNLEDWWRDPPNLDIVSKSQDWMQMRFMRARYFKDAAASKRGEAESHSFNVFRRLDADHNSSKLWDKTDNNVESQIGLMRSRATLWMQPADEKHNDTQVAILLLDPTIQEGHYLWREYRNWVKPPRMGGGLPEEVPPLGKSFFEDFIYWACRPDVFGSPGSGHKSSEICVPTQALLHLICNEWLTMADYLKTRLNQVDWEIAFPWDFISKDDQIDSALMKLHQWRRVVPVYREMLAETFLRVFRETAHPTKINPTPSDPAEKESSALDDLRSAECVNAYKSDFSLVLSYMEEYQERIDRLTNVVTAVINMQDSRRGFKDNRNLQWLTWLATFFIPLSFVATMLSMSSDPWELGESTKLWAEVSIPSGLLILSMILLMSIAKCRRAIRKFFRERFVEPEWLKKTSSKTKNG